MLKVRKTAPFSVTDFTSFLQSHNVGSRMLFGGNLLRQPVMVQLKNDNPKAFRVVGETQGADQLMNQALFLGTYPGLSKSMLNYEIEIIEKFLNSKI
jgi:CDP-6-deoxy-D-xylo-4-hexulose-3-dehydrase